MPFAALTKAIAAAMIKVIKRGYFMKFLKKSMHPFLSSFFFIVSLIYLGMFFYALPNGYEQSWKNGIINFFIYLILSVRFYYADASGNPEDKKSKIFTSLAVIAFAVYFLSIILNAVIFQSIALAALFIYIFISTVHEIILVKKSKKEE